MGTCVALLVILLANLIWGQSLKTVSESGTTFIATRTTDVNGSSIWVTDGRGLSATTDTQTISDSVTSTIDYDTTSTVYISSAPTSESSTATPSYTSSVVATSTTTVTLKDQTVTQTMVPAPQPPTIPSVMTSTVTTVQVSSVFLTETATESAVQTITESSYYKTITRTIIRQAPHLISEYHAMLNGTDVAITGTVGTYGNTIVYVTPAAQVPVTPVSVCWFPDQPQGYDCQSILQGAFSAEEIRIIGMEYHELRAEFPALDWGLIGRVSVSLQASVSWLEAIKNALICVRRRGAQITSRPDHYHDPHAVPGHIPATATRTAEVQRRGKNATPSVSELMIWASPTGHNELLIPITNYTQRVGNEMVVVANYTPFNYRAAARMDPMPTPGSCVKHSHGYNKTECAWEMCMLRHHIPVNVTTIMPALVGEPGCQKSAWVTMTSSLTGAHWGQTTKGVYWPAYSSNTVMHGKPTETIAYWTPPDKVQRKVFERIQEVFHERHGHQSCLDKRSCCEECEKEARHGGHSDPFLWNILAVASGATLAALLLGVCCCLCCSKRIRSRKSMLNSVLSHKANQPMQEVVQTVESAPSAAAATAATVASGVESAADSGRGTVARRIEEGRNRVSFAPEALAGAGAAAGATAAEAAHGAGEGGQKVVETAEKVPEAAGQAGQQVVTTTTTGAQQAGQAAGQAGHEVQQVVVTPAQQVISSGGPTTSPAPQPTHDGASDAFGSGFTNDPYGSLRGRKRARYPGLNF
ncbi:Ca2+-modulated nonselective cation channel polycystin [Teratosphaeria destructans]|uniref:Ca2+-modulated nonselective cation channel polycystin n=1 Tax=Teratosphaeria destructans TaxID=418781 RepID=A0A9W7T1L7_9PEZI|nr:Ca2+-modulated nonselective cation channel polycystin [Teratosphaeria destructans]